MSSLADAVPTIASLFTGDDLAATAAVAAWARPTMLPAAEIETLLFEGRNALALASTSTNVLPFRKR